MDLVIVESPHKAQEIQKMLGSGYVVKASLGHVRDLPQKQLGVDLNSFLPDYIETERGKKTIANLKAQAKKADSVWLATDLDREGEAIAWHLLDALKLNPANTKRVVYNEITERAVKEAFKHARRVDDQMVKAQTARRVLDRLVGYTVSPALWESGIRGLSAGRVQSVALRLIVERDRQIKNHSKQKHYGVTASVSEGSHQFEAEWDSKAYQNDEKLVLNREPADNTAKAQKLVVTGCSRKVKKRSPQPPFTTSTLQQEASAKLSMTTSQTMKAAQALYEAGRITYMRTDSVNLSDEAIENIRSYAENKNLPIPDQPINHETKDSSAQEAHECVRPTDMFYDGSDLSGDQLKLYELVHRRTLICQLKPASVEETDLAAKVSQPGDCQGEPFKAKGVIIKEAGFMEVAGRIEEKEVPDLGADTVIDVITAKVTEKQTKPPSHYTEGTLTKEMEKKGIGRPSTFASIIENIKKKGYVTTKSQKLLATELGDKLISILMPDEETMCSFMGYEYTASMEADLDKIAGGSREYFDSVKSAYDVIKEDTDKVAQNVKTSGIENASTDALSGTRKRSTRTKKATNKVGSEPDRKSERNMQSQRGKRPTASDKKCSKCGSAMKKRKGAYGEFFGCTAYPDCKNTEKA